MAKMLKVGPSVKKNHPNCEMYLIVNLLSFLSLIIKSIILCSVLGYLYDGGMKI